MTIKSTPSFYVAIAGAPSSGKTNLLTKLAESLKLEHSSDAILLDDSEFVTLKAARSNLNPSELQMAIEYSIMEKERHRRGRMMISTTSLVSRNAYAKVKALHLDTIYGALIGKLEDATIYDFLFYLPPPEITSKDTLDMDREIRRILSSRKISYHILSRNQDANLEVIQSAIKFRQY